MIRTEERDGVRILHMEFGAANAISPAMQETLIEALDDGSRVPTVLTGEGAIFSAGLNLVALDGVDRDGLEGFVERFSVLMTRTLTVRYPLVAAVNGHAVAGGCVLAMACDHRVGVEGKFKIGMNEMAIGLTLPAVVTEILRGKLSPEHARTIILGGALYTPAEAVDVGLLDELAGDADAAIDRAARVARNYGRAPVEFAAMKGSLVSPITERLQQTREALDRRFVDSWFGEQATELRRATVEKLTARANREPDS